MLVPLQDIAWSTLVGSPLYLSPEIIGGVATYTEKVDIYSVGVIAYELVFGTTPFGDAKSFEELFMRIFDGR